MEALAFASQPRVEEKFFRDHPGPQFFFDRRVTPRRCPEMKTDALSAP